MGARSREADRAQLRWEMVDLERQLAADHKARVVWAFVSGLDLSALYAAIRAREGEPGRPPADPKLLLALWLYATLERVGSARQLDRLCERDVAYRWLCGGVAMNHHGLSDFRVAHGEVLDRLLTESLTALLAEGVVKLDEVAIDGTKIRASAGSGSFRCERKLSSLEAAARADRDRQPDSQRPGHGYHAGALDRQSGLRGSSASACPQSLAGALPAHRAGLNANDATSPHSVARHANRTASPTAATRRCRSRTRHIECRTHPAPPKPLPRPPSIEKARNSFTGSKAGVQGCAHEFPCRPPGFPLSTL